MTIHEPVRYGIASPVQAQVARCRRNLEVHDADPYHRHARRHSARDPLIHRDGERGWDAEPFAESVAYRARRRAVLRRYRLASDHRESPAQSGDFDQCVDIFARRGYRFNGTARLLLAADPDLKEVAEWIWRTNGPDYPVNNVVRIDVREALPLLSPAYRFGEGASEDALRQVYLAKYRVQEQA